MTDKKDTKKPADHPNYSDMITAAIKALKERKGSSRQAIIKYITGNYNVGDNCSNYVKQALKRGVAGKKFVQLKGTGASGSFKLGESGKPAKKPVAKKQAKKPATAKKPIAKKPNTKKTAKKPTLKAKSGDKKASTGKKKTKSPPKKKPAKKTAGKKTPTKKAKKTTTKKSAKKATKGKK